MTAAVDTGAVIATRWKPHASRTFVAGTDTPPPEHAKVPLQGSDFASQSEERAIREPLRVTGPDGEVLPMWLSSRRAFGVRGQVAMQNIPAPEAVHARV
jgi:hypothetical protein